MLQRVLGTVAMDKQSSWQQIRVAIRSKYPLLENEAKSLINISSCPMDIDEQLLELGSSDSDVDLIMPSKVLRTY